MLSAKQLRWCAVWVLVFASALNYLDRMVLMALMPTLQEVFGASREQLGILVSVFSICYAFSSPPMGLAVDSMGLRWGTAIVVALWSAIGIATGFAGSMTALLICRAMLGVAESGGIPATSKGVATYLPADSWALGSALSQVGLTLGSTAAPILTEWLIPMYGWRSVFVVSGAIGFVWLPAWLFTSAKIPPMSRASPRETAPVREMLSDRRFLSLIAANFLAMTIYSLWTTWTTLFLVSRYGLTREQANLSFAWIPPWFFGAGALLGGWLALRLIRGGLPALRARVRIATIAAVFAMMTGLASAAPGPGWATAAICISVAAVSCLSVNYYSIPADLFGPGRAAFGVSMLTAVYGLMQTFLSPLIGRWSEQLGWQPVCTAIAVLPLASVFVLRGAFSRS
jgi:ACS family hexuronate transporter-like MFS transporter